MMNINANIIGTSVVATALLDNAYTNENKEYYTDENGIIYLSKN